MDGLHSRSTKKQKKTKTFAKKPVLFIARNCKRKQVQNKNQESKNKTKK